MSKVIEEIGIFLSVLLTCYIAHKLDSYNIFTIYFLIRIWVLMLKGDSNE